MKKVFCLFFVALVMGIITPLAAQDDALVIADFEDGLTFTSNETDGALGFIPWGDAFENVTLSARQIVPFGAMALPEREEAVNNVLAVNYDIGGWGGFSHVLTDGENWISMDWTPYNALRFWIYGGSSGGAVQIDLFDNRNPDVNGDSAERWYFRINDDFTGWRQFTIPFAAFQRRTDFQPNGAPNDGLGLDAVSGYAFGFPAGVGAQTLYLDDIEVIVAENADTVTVVGETTTEAAASETGEEITWDSREWELIWSDEFDDPAGTLINSENWTCEVGGHGWGNNEHQFYTRRPENVSMNGDGQLAIVAREERLPDSNCWYGVCKYTSARCITNDKVEFTYGRVEARIKVPFGQGIWPAFWMLGADFERVRWPASGEIDIMEVVGMEPSTVHGTIHGPNYSGGSGLSGSKMMSEPLADDYHIFAIDWDVDAIRWYIDGELYHSVTPADLGNRTWVFDKDFFLLLNVAVGGNWPGYPDETTTFPQTMLVDYVRIYQLVEE